MKKYAVPFWDQYVCVTRKGFVQYWRTPSYTYSKLSMHIVCSLFNELVFFKTKKSLQGLQDQMYSMFILFILMDTLIRQYLPHFVAHRIYMKRKKGHQEIFHGTYLFLLKLVQKFHS